MYVYIYLYIYICREYRGLWRCVCCCTCGLLLCMWEPLLLSCLLHHAPSSCFKPDSTCIYILLDNLCMSVGFCWTSKTIVFSMFLAKWWKTFKIQIKPKKTNKTIENTPKPMISSNLRSPGLGRPTLISLGSWDCWKSLVYLYSQWFYWFSLV